MPPERRAVLLVLGLAVLGQGIRLWVGRPDVPPGGIRLIGGGIPAAPGAHRDSSVALARPLTPGERVDLDRASAVEIARLPRVGPKLARAIVANRQTHGAFGSLEALDRVPGIGPGLMTAIGGQVEFSAAGRLGGSRPLAEAGFAAQTSASGATPASPASRAAEPPSRPAIDLNTATLAELEALPFVGPYMAQQILTYRARHGRFPTVDSLVRVPGIGPATIAKIRDMVVVH
jgi:competence ComEA-like helix-hairpin-helix protein